MNNLHAVARHRPFSSLVRRGLSSALYMCAVHVRVLVRGHLISRRIAPEQALLTRAAGQPDCVARTRQWALRALVVGATSWPPD